MITGRCECGAVQYEVDGEVTDFSHCHCSQCRRLHGAAFASFGEIPRDKLRYLSGESDLSSYASSPIGDRYFCRHCGSSILADYKPDKEHLYIAIGTVDGEPALPAAYHIYVGSKAHWVEINDGLEQHDSEP